MSSIQQPFGKYFLLEQIGSGGMSEIFKAKTFGSDGFEKTVVIKRILPHWASDPEFIQMLIDEAKIAVLLNHINIVAVFDLGSFESSYFIAMEYLEGFDLKTLLERVIEKEKRIPPEIACFIAIQGAAGLEYAHQKRDLYGNPLHIVHRDISPHNLLISHEGDVKITDFGIAKATFKKNFTATGTLKGKLSYMSPEQVRGENLTGQSDLFSLGIVLYEMLTGKKLFTGNTEIEIIDKIRKVEIKKEDLPDFIPEKLQTILLRSLAAKTVDRYQTAEEMQIDLARFLAEIHPGFLPKDLAKFIQEYKKEKPYEKPSGSMKAYSFKENVSDSAETAISYMPGYKTTPLIQPKKKKSSYTVLILIFIFFILIGIVSAFYFGFTRVIQPRLFGKKAPISNSSFFPIPPIQKDSLGMVELKSTPTGASIFLDHVDTGLKTPASLKNISLSVGHTLSLSLEGYQSWEKPILLVNSIPLSLEASLSKVESGKAYVVSTPAGADIFLNGSSTGLKTPAVLENLNLNQSHHIRLMKSGYLPLEAVYTPKSGNLEQLDLPLRENSQIPPPNLPKRKTNPIQPNNGISKPYLPPPSEPSNFRMGY